MITDTDLVSSVRDVRKLITVLDSIGFQVVNLNNDEELSILIPDNLQNNLIDLTKDMHNMVQIIEKSNSIRYTFVHSWRIS